MKLALYKGKGNWLNYLIRLKTKSPYSHVELVFSDGIYFSSSYPDGGTRFKDVKGKKGNWDFLTLNLTKEQEEKIRVFCKKEDGKKYDVFSILFSQLLGLQINKKSDWFCSEICTKALQEINLFVGYSAFTVDPGEMFEILNGEINSTVFTFN